MNKAFIISLVVIEAYLLNVFKRACSQTSNKKCMGKNEEMKKVELIICQHM